MSQKIDALEFAKTQIRLVISAACSKFPMPASITYRPRLPIYFHISTESPSKPELSLVLRLLYSEQPKLHRVFAVQSAIGLTLKAPNKHCSRRPFTFSLLSFEENKAWFFMWILCLAEDSLETSSLISSEKQRKNIYECCLLQSRLAL